MGEIAAALGAGNLTAGALVGIVVLLVLTDRLRPARRADRELQVITEQRDDAIDAVREAHEVNRHLAESIRTLADASKRLADGQDVAVRLIRAALPPSVDDDHRRTP